MSDDGSRCGEISGAGQELSHIPRDWDDYVVLCAGNPWSGIKLADQQLAERLADQVPVLYVDPPQSVLRRRRRSGRSSPPTVALERISDNLVCVRPTAPPLLSRPGVTRVATALLRRSLGHLVDNAPATIRATISAWPLYPVSGACNETVSVFWAQDDFSAAAESWGLSPARVARAEAARVDEADLVIAANPVTYERWRGQSTSIELIPYGADTSAYAAFDDIDRAIDVRLPRPMAVVVGQLNFRIDLALLESVVDARVSLLLVGPVNHPDRERMRRLLAHPLVQSVGTRSISEVASYLRCADVGLVPYNHSAFNGASFPLKTLEYLAARLPVVTTDLPATRWLNTALITVADNARAFGKAAAKAANEVDDAGLRGFRWSFAQQHSYACRADAFLIAIDRVARKKRSEGALVSGRHLMRTDRRKPTPDAVRPTPGTSVRSDRDETCP